MKLLRGRHWSYHELPGSSTLELFDMIGLKIGAQHYLGYRPESLYETSASIWPDISEKTAKLLDTSGFRHIKLNAHTALLLFFENILTAEALSHAQEDEQSITLKVSNLKVVVEENPRFAIAYFNHAGSLLAA